MMRDWFYEEVNTPAGITLPYFLTQLNTLWPDLESSRQVHVNSEEGVANTLACWENPIRQRSPDIHWPSGSAFPAFMHEADPDVVQDGVLPISKGLMAILRTRPDMADYEVATPAGRARLQHWRLTLGCREYRFLQFKPEEIAYLKAPGKAYGWLRKRLPRIANMLMVFYGGHPETQARLTAGEIDLMEKCWAETGSLLLEALENAVVLHVDAPTGSPKLGTRNEHGINVVGFATGQFGVGEDARMATRVLSKAGLEPCVYEPPIPLASAHRQGGWIDLYLKAEPQSRVNFITLPAVDTLRLFFLQQADVLAGRYNICGWQWELPKWPQRWRGLMSIPDEIWAQSRYLHKMFSESTEKPVTYIPSAVDIPDFEEKPRSDFGIPKGPFAFLSVFDCNGWYQRKNPLAAVRAFQAAFGPSNRDVQLIVKMMNSRSEAPVHQELMRLASQDSRILIIDRFLSRSDMLALLNCADVFVSLHRSEGFGRVVAECMLMGKPVISTNYSGSLDFAHEGTAYVVNGPMIPLQKGDYADHEGQSWMDPDIGEAAKAMKRCVEDRLGTAEMALRGQAFLQTHHSIEAVAKLYKKRLDQLGVF